jgi:hypothetical protein
MGPRPFIPEPRFKFSVVDAIQRRQGEAGGEDDLATWGDVGAYEIKATGVSLVLICLRRIALIVN